MRIRHVMTKDPTCCVPSDSAQHAACIMRDEHVGIVKGLLEGKTEFPGLAVDTDLRWLIVQSLAGLGAIDDGVIEAELRRDPTDQGHRYAAGARAASTSLEEIKADANFARSAFAPIWRLRWLHRVS